VINIVLISEARLTFSEANAFYLRHMGGFTGGGGGGGGGGGVRGRG
jgi:hypothetical protein